MAKQSKFKHDRKDIKRLKKVMDNNKYKEPKWKCPINFPGCKENCGNYGCGN